MDGEWIKFLINHCRLCTPGWRECCTIAAPSLTLSGTHSLSPDCRSFFSIWILSYPNTWIWRCWFLALKFTFCSSGQWALPWLCEPPRRCFHWDPTGHWDGSRPLPPRHEVRHGEEGRVAQLRGGPHHPAPVHQTCLPQRLQVLAQIPSGQGWCHWKQCWGSSSHRLWLDLCQGRCRVRVKSEEFRGGNIKCFEYPSFGKCVLFPNWVNIEFSTLKKKCNPLLCASQWSTQENIDLYSKFLIVEKPGKLKPRICHGLRFRTIMWWPHCQGQPCINDYKTFWLTSELCFRVFQDGQALWYSDYYLLSWGKALPGWQWTICNVMKSFLTLLLTNLLKPLSELVFVFTNLPVKVEYAMEAIGHAGTCLGRRKHNETKSTMTCMSYLGLS